MALKAKMIVMILELVLVFILMQLRKSGRQTTECTHISQKRLVQDLRVHWEL